MRLQTYQAALNGAAGQIFGNNPIWHFDGPGLYSVPTTWHQALNSRGAQSMTVFCNLLVFRLEDLSAVKDHGALIMHAPTYAREMARKSAKAACSRKAS